MPPGRNCSTWIAADDWWIDVTVPALERARSRLRCLSDFVERTPRNPGDADFADTLGESRRGLRRPG